YAQGGKLTVPPCAKRGEVPRRGGGVMGRSRVGASDPSVADYRATSPRYAQGGKLTVPPCAKRGEVPRRGGGVMGLTDIAPSDPSVADDRAASPRYAQGGKLMSPACAQRGEVPRGGRRGHESHKDQLYKVPHLCDAGMLPSIDAELRPQPSPKPDGCRML